jgi:HSP20 family protein
MARALHPRVYFPSIEDFRREIEDIFSRSLERTGPQKTRSAFPSIETSCDGNEYLMRVDLPGIDPKEIELTVNGDVVTLRGSREHHDKQESWDVIYCELVHGDFERKLTLPPGIRTQDIKAAYIHGVVELRMPAPKQVVERQVPIQFEATKAKHF